MGRRQIQRPVPPQRRGDRPAGRLFALQTRTSDARPYILPVILRRDEHCSSGIRNECNLPKANLTSRSPPRRKVAGCLHRGPQANPTSRTAATQGGSPCRAIVCFANADEQCSSLHPVRHAAGVGALRRTSDARPYAPNDLRLMRRMAQFTAPKEHGPYGSVCVTRGRST